MANKYVDVDLSNEEKETILKLAGHFVIDEKSKKDLKNNRKKWIQFTVYDLTEVIGELSYYFNRSKSDYQFHLLDQLIGHLEFYERRK